MKKRFILAIAFVLLSGVVHFAFTIDCWAQLTLDVNAAVAQQASDYAHCGDIALMFPNLCYQEADLVFNGAIDDALIAFDDCRD